MFKRCSKEKNCSGLSPDFSPGIPCIIHTSAAIWNSAMETGEAPHNLSGEISNCNEKWIGTHIYIQNMLHFSAEHIEVQEFFFCFLFFCPKIFILNMFTHLKYEELEFLHTISSRLFAFLCVCVCLV